jgi:hypothetical protein
MPKIMGMLICISWAINRVNVELETNVSKLSSVSIIRIDPDDGDTGDLSNVRF